LFFPKFYCGCNWIECISWGIRNGGQGSSVITVEKDGTKSLRKHG